jgi:hypothetical protein
MSYCNTIDDNRLNNIALVGWQGGRLGASHLTPHWLGIPWALLTLPLELHWNSQWITSAHPCMEGGDSKGVQACS